MTDLTEQFPLATMDFYRRGLAVGSYTEDQIRSSLRRGRVTVTFATGINAHVLLKISAYF